MLIDGNERETAEQVWGVRMTEEAIKVAGGMFQMFGEVDSKWSKLVQKEYDSLNSTSEKYFKKVAVCYRYRSINILH